MLPQTAEATIRIHIHVHDDVEYGLGIDVSNGKGDFVGEEYELPTAEVERWKPRELEHHNANREMWEVLQGQAHESSATEVEAVTIQVYVNPNDVGSPILTTEPMSDEIYKLRELHVPSTSADAWKNAFQNFYADQNELRQLMRS